jgi:hypothetical protein
MEFVLTAGLVSTILGTSSKAQNLGPISAFGVGAYIILAGLWASPISGASMNPARSFGPDLLLWNFSSYWIYIVGPVAGALLAVLTAGSRLLDCSQARCSLSRCPACVGDCAHSAARRAGIPECADATTLPATLCEPAHHTDAPTSNYSRPNPAPILVPSSFVGFYKLYCFLFEFLCITWLLFGHDTLLCRVYQISLL